jgi:hypothetical protein
MTSPPLLHSLLHTNCCKQVQEDEEIQNDIDFFKHQAEVEVAPLGSASYLNGLARNFPVPAS